MKTTTITTKLYPNNIIITCENTGLYMQIFGCGDFFNHTTTEREAAQLSRSYVDSDMENFPSMEFFQKELTDAGEYQKSIGIAENDEDYIITQAEYMEMRENAKEEIYQFYRRIWQDMELD